MTILLWAVWLIVAIAIVWVALRVRKAGGRVPRMPYVPLDDDRDDAPATPRIVEAVASMTATSAMGNPFKPVQLSVEIEKANEAAISALVSHGVPMSDTEAYKKALAAARRRVLQAHGMLPPDAA
ncbi:MAG: hypothetical protein ABL982_03470 [Vicinamibacterales bacterium]